MKKGKFSAMVSAIVKSFGGKDGDVKESGKEGDEDELDLDDDDVGKDSMNKSEDELVDGTELLEGIRDELAAMNKSLAALTERQETIEKSNADIGGAVVGVAEIVAKIANSPVPPKSVMNKSSLGGGYNGGTMTRGEYLAAQSFLEKSVKEGLLDMVKASVIETELQKAQRIPGFQMNEEYRELIVNGLKK